MAGVQRLESDQRPALRPVATSCSYSLVLRRRAQVHPLGYSLVEIHEKAVGMTSRPWVLSTPVDGEVVDMTLVGQVRKIRKPRRFYSDLQPAGRTTPQEAAGGGP